jgi:steroid 5-alpha reductase family enzyme
MLKLLIIDLILTILIFLQSVILKNASMYDMYWSVLPFFFLGYWLFEFHVETLNYRMMLTILMVTIWSFRLTYNWYRGWKGIKHEDWRYKNLRSKTGVFYPLINFLGIHLFPTILVFLASMPLESIFSSTAKFGILDALGVAIMALGILFEMLADNQMHQFKSDPINKGRFINSGIWRFSRHPNYLGEILFWWGLYVISIDAGVPTYYIIGPILISLLFIGISIPMMEKRLVKNYDNYLDYKKNTSTLIPFIY